MCSKSGWGQEEEGNANGETTGRDVDWGRGGCRGRFRGVSSPGRPVIDAVVEPSKDVVDAIANVAAELHGSWPVASRAPPVDGRKGDREQIT